MVKRATILLPLLLFVAAFAAYADVPSTEAIRRASHEATRRGYDLSLYLSPRVQFRRADDTWEIYYTRKPDKRGLVPVDADFLIYIHRHTGEVRFSPGH